jgi:hypothetical protein
MAVVIDGTTGISTVGLTASGAVSAAGVTTTTLDATSQQKQGIVAVAALDIDCSAGNYFTKTINGSSTFTFSNAPSSRAYSFTLELTVTSGSATWPASVAWPSSTAPTLSTSKTSLLMFVTDDAGTRWRGAALVDYTT